MIRDGLNYVLGQLDFIEKRDKKNKNSEIIFNKTEVKQMQRLNDCTYRLKKDGIHEIRYRRGGVEKSFSSKNLKTAKQKAISFLKDLDRGLIPQKNTPMFNEFAKDFMEIFKKPNVRDKTYSVYESRLRIHIFPYTEGKQIESITTKDLQIIINRIAEEKKKRTLEDVIILLRQIFTYALNNEIIRKNPVDGVQVRKHYRTHGQALSREDEKILLDKFKGHKYEGYIVTMLYTGCRFCELSTVKLEGEFIIVENKKRKGDYIEYKKIPITPMMKPFIPFIGEMKASDRTVSRHFHNLMKGYTMKDLRHTFISRCQMCGVPENVVRLWAGHSPKGITQSVYTHFDDEFLINEGQKVSYKI